MTFERSKRAPGGDALPAADDPGSDHPARQTARQLVHGRQLVCRAYRRDDGHWDVEGRLADVKTCDVALPGGARVAAGEPYRALALALTVDDAFTVRDARVEVDVTTAGPARGAGAQAARAALLGQRIDALGAIETSKRFLRAADCADLSELLGALIATARETIPPPRATLSRRDADD
jgi:hypothetical protein